MRFSLFKKKEKKASVYLTQYRQSHRERQWRKKLALGRNIKIRVQKSFLNRYRGFLSFFFVAGLLGGGIYFFLISSFFRISSIAVERTALTTDVVAVQSSLKDVVGKSIFFLDTAKITRDLRTSFPEIKTVNLTRLFPRTLKVALEEYPVVGRLKEETTGKTWLLNEVGQVQDKATSLADLPLIEYKNVYQFSYPDIDQQFTNLLHLQDKAVILSATEMKSIFDARNYVTKEFGLKVNQMEYYPLEEELHMTVDKGFVLWLDLGQDVIKQLNKLHISVNPFHLYTTNFDYIDLRVTQKIIFCIKGEICSGASTAPAKNQTQPVGK